ncbi:MAG: DUF3883 domain-containing protein [Thermosphaera sp.]
MSTESLRRLEPYTGYELSEQAKSLIKSVINGFRYHPFFFMLRNSTYSDDPVYPFAHQLELLSKLFARRPIRVIIGDEIGLGKTISAIMLIRYLLEVEEIKRALILVPRVLIKQWLMELKRFNLVDIKRLERDTISKYHRQGFPQGIYLASIDLVKMKEHKAKILDSFWDLVVIDEAHRIGKRGNIETQRFALVKQLTSKPNVHVIMLTATPHRGKAEDYIERLKLVDPFIRADPRELDDEKFYRLCMGSIVFRRTKLDVNEVYEGTKIFTDCKFKARVVKASEEEESFHRELVEFLRAKLLQYYDRVGEEPRALPLLLALIAKRASSSPRAAVITLDRIIRRRAERIKALESGDLHAVEVDLDNEASLVADVLLGYSFEEGGLYEDEREERIDADELLKRFTEKCSIFLEDEDIKKLMKLHDLARKILDKGDSRLASLVNVVYNHLKNGDKVVIFTEFRDTAEYVFDELRKRLPEFSDKIAMITSEEIRPPTKLGLHSRKYDIEDVKKWLKSGDILLLVSTDVASEGLNLQVANVVVHYEPSWSPVKMVQRIGRVWRLGQEKNVTSYSLLLSVESDMAALEILYAKLLSWMISGIEKKVLIGEELEIDMLPRDKAACDLLQIPLTTEKGRPQYSEFKAWIEFIAGGKDRLRRYVEQIVEALRRLKEQAERLGLNNMEEVKVKRFLNEGLGGLYGDEAKRLLIRLLKLVARFSGYEVEERSSGIFVKGVHMTGLKDLLDLWKATESLLRDVVERAPVVLIARTLDHDDFRNLKELHLYEVTVHLDGKPTFSETVGVVVKEDGTKETLRGLALFKLFLKLMDNVVGIGDVFWSKDDEYGDRVRTPLLYVYYDRIVSEYARYIEEVERLFSHEHSGWLPGERAYVTRYVSASQRLLGVIVSTSTGEAGRAPPPEAVEEVERKAMEYAMEFERRNQRIPEDVSKKEHYDIRSVDPKTGEIRFIEVKGRWPMDIAVELTETEFEFGKRIGNNYWLYVVYGFSTGSPRLLAIRDPINKAKWKVKEVKKYQLVGV